MRLMTALVTGLLLGRAASAGLQVTVDGEGYLRFAQDGRICYAKSADLVTTNGALGLSNGAKLMPAITVSGSASLAIDLEGNVTAGGRTLGRLVLAAFRSAQQDSGTTFVATERPVLGNPGEGTFGVIRVNGQVSVTKSLPTALKTAPIEKPVKASLAADIPGKTVVTLADRTAVEGDTITLGSIATIKAPPAIAEKLQSINLGDTPMLPIERLIDRNRINAKIKLAGIDPDTISLIGPDKVKVTRKGQTVTNEQFVDAAVQGAKIKGYTGTLEPAAPGPDVTVPLGELQLVCESVSGSNVDMTATVGIYVDGKRYNSRSIKLHSTFSTPQLKAGTVVTVRVRSRAVFVDSKGKVVKFDPATGQATVTISDTGAQLTGTVTPEGIVEVKA